MPRYTKPLVLAILLAHLVLFCTGRACGEEGSKLPADAQKVIDAFDADAAKMRADTEKLIEKKAVALATALQKSQETATKKGDLDGAMAIKEKLAALGVKGAGEAAKPKTLVGSWSAIWDRGNNGANLAHETWVFNNDGTCASGQVHGKWAPKNNGFEIRWDLGFVDTIKTFTDEGESATATRSNEKTISLKRQ